MCCVRKRETDGASGQRKIPKKHKQTYLNNANTVVAAAAAAVATVDDSFILIMRCDLALRSIWFLFVVIRSIGLLWPSLLWKKGTNFQHTQNTHHAMNRIQVVMQRDPRARIFISFSVCLIQC